MINSIKSLLKLIISPKNEIYYVKRSLRKNKDKLEDLISCDDRDSGIDIEIYKTQSKIQRLENWLKVLKSRKNAD